jgi:hypothetical protein
MASSADIATDGMGLIATIFLCVNQNGTRHCNRIY